MIKNLFRNKRVKLTPFQDKKVESIKKEAEKLRKVIKVNYLKADVETIRCVDIAIQKLEESVMWAVKGYTNKGE